MFKFVLVVQDPSLDDLHAFKELSISPQGRAAVTTEKRCYPPATIGRLRDLLWGPREEGEVGVRDNVVVGVVAA